jgi:membrane associated rhomboid family serine protease
MLAQVVDQGAAGDGRILARVQAAADQVGRFRSGDSASAAEDVPIRFGAVFIPLGTNLDAVRRPLVVYGLVALNIAIHIVVFSGFRREDSRVADWFDTLALRSSDIHWWGAFSYQFLHDPSGIMHIASNMIFLLAFGGVVEGRLGRLGFLALYLVGGALAGLLQIALTGGSVIGASGSVSVVAGAFLALHPRGSVHGLWLLPPSRVSMPAAWLLGLYAAIDLVNTFTDLLGATRTGVGTIAHLAGLVFGLGVCMGLLGLGVLKRNDFDLFFLLKQWKRRRDLRAATSVAGLGIADGPVAARVRSGTGDEMSPKERTLRHTIAAAHRERDLVLSAQLYRELLALNPRASLPAPLQLDVANQLATEGDWRSARTAYSVFLERFRGDPATPDARLMLAVIELRRLGDAPAALATIEAIDRARLDPDKGALVDALRAEANAAVAAGPARSGGAG